MLFNIYIVIINIPNVIMASVLVKEKINLGKRKPYSEFSKVIKKEESNNNAIIGITKLIPRVSKIDVVTNKNTNK